MKPTCPHCGNDDESMLEEIGFVGSRIPLSYAMNTTGMTEDEIDKAHEIFSEENRLKSITYLCVSCSKEFTLECN